MSNDQQNGRRNFLKNVAIGSTGLLATQMLNIETVQVAVESSFSPKKHGTNSILSNKSFESPGVFKGMPIKTTFLDEVSWDIPHQNRDVNDWKIDFSAMKAIGINTVVMIRSGLGKWIASPFDSIIKTENVYYPQVDLVEIFFDFSRHT